MNLKHNKTNKQIKKIHADIDMLPTYMYLYIFFKGKMRNMQDKNKNIESLI